MSIMPRSPMYTDLQYEQELHYAFEDGFVSLIMFARDAESRQRVLDDVNKRVMKSRLALNSRVGIIKDGA